LGVDASPSGAALTRYAVAGFRPFTLDLERLHGELGVAPDVDLILAAAEVASVRGYARP